MHIRQNRGYKSLALNIHPELLVESMGSAIIKRRDTEDHVTTIELQQLVFSGWCNSRISFKGSLCKKLGTTGLEQ